MLTKVLVVDDEPDLEFLIERKFRKRIRAGELEFVFAHNGFEALEKLQSNPDVDVILSDINMPKMDGLTLLAQLNESYPLLRTVIISAYGDMKNIRTAMNRGSFDFLTKPIDLHDLETTLNKTIAHVRQLQAAHQLAEIQQELIAARHIHQAILPEAIPDLPRLDIQVQYRPMKSVGGDFYDFHQLDQDRLAALVADVSGHGIPAALIAAMVKIAFSIQEALLPHPGRVLSGMNRLLSGKVKNQFLTASYIYLDLAQGKLYHANAGHYPLLIWRKQSQQLHEFNPDGIVMGWLAEAEYAALEVEVQPGDRIILYTDAIVECRDKAGQMFGEDRFFALVQEKQDLSAAEFAHLIPTHLSHWSAQSDGFDDDLTLVVIDILP